MANGWKQPIPTNLDTEFNDNRLAKWIYILLLLRARNSDEEKQFAGSLHFLKRGQCVCGMQEIADEFRVNRKTVKTTLTKLQKVYNKLDIRFTSKGTVITINNYDDVVSMGQQNGQQSNNKVTTKGQQSNTNKSVKSVKIEKNVENHTLATTVADQIPVNDLIKLFEPINPSYETLYANRTQRSALERMYKTHGDKLPTMIKALEKIIILPYAPKVTTPLELENKMGQLKAYIQQRNAEKRKGGVASATD